MLKALKNEANMTYTENGAVTNASTMSDCLDFFGTAGALRNADEDDILRRFIRAFTEDRDIAMKILFFARDVRGGLGERRIFRTVMNYLADQEPETVRKNLGFFAEYGRWDDVLALMGTACEKDALALIRAQLSEDMKVLHRHAYPDDAAELNEFSITGMTPAAASISLLAKWLPSVNTSNAGQCALGKKIAKACGMTEREYRKTLAALRKEIRIIENNLREKDYSFDYEKQPSKALYKYKKAFLRNDNERYTAFIQAALQGKAKLNAGNLYPYELVDPYLDMLNFRMDNRSFMRRLTPEEKEVLNATWAALPDYCNKKNVKTVSVDTVFAKNGETGYPGAESALAVIDTSGSMYNYDCPKPASVALSLGLYFAEHNKGAFANHFMTFSGQPRLVELKGETFADRLRYVASFNEIANTNVEAAFRLILRTAVKNHLPQEELPAKLVIISDMEFDFCARNASLSNFENAKQMFEAAGYRLPQLIFWNVASRHANQPVRMHETGTALVSGCTPRLFSMIAGDVVDPYVLMMEVIGSERYAKIAA